jgi:hypothetical protein
VDGREGGREREREVERKCEIEQVRREDSLPNMSTSKYNAPETFSGRYCSSLGFNALISIIDFAGNISINFTS